MRPAAFAIALALVLPTLALTATPITPADAVAAADELIRTVGGYTSRHPDEPGGCAEWMHATITSGGITAAEPLLIHSYPDLVPSYYYVALTTERTGASTFVTIDAATGEWQAFGARSARAPLPALSPEAAALLATRELGVSVFPADLRAVSMPNKSIYWHWSDGTPEGPSARQLFINVSDASDSHTWADPVISPPLSQRPAPRESQTGHAAPGQERTDEQRFPTSYDISGVPHHYQLTSYDCGPAAAEMVMDYFGPDITQADVADVANSLNPGGSYTDDMRRTGHFSAISSAVQDTSLHGYDERKLGYGSMENRWSHPNTSDPDYVDRYNDLKELVSSNFPIMPVMYYDASHEATHYRVLKGYNDSTNVFIAHDPWYTGAYQGPNVSFNQTFFVDNLWAYWFRWALLMCPWEVQLDCPTDVYKGETFTVRAIVYYHGPHPYEGQDPASSRVVTISMSPIFTLASGETAAQTLPGSAPSGIGNLVTWHVVADTVELGGLINVRAQGYITDSSTSYASYADSIGGWAGQGVTIWEQSGVDDSLPAALMLYPARPSPFTGETTLALDIPAG
ncbi:MAG: C39 family peptidase, partial [Candidatus Eisenbacteria bacterium]|nr:C39 family peptidase [Candidatus Eisenbacteria bacterium]